MGGIDNILDYFDPEVGALDLRKYYIKNLPSDIGKFKNLHNLNISGTRMESLPDELVNLENLQVLFASNNNIKELPKNLGDLSELKILSLEGNPLKGLPDSIKKLDGKLLKLKLPKEMSDQAKNKVEKLLPKTKIMWV